MKGSLSRFASALILLEWGAVMLYFDLSGRVSAFLHPNFRPLLFVTGVLLVLTAGVIAFTQESGCCAVDEAASKCDRKDSSGRISDEHGNHAHGRHTASAVRSFFVLCFPLGLAAMISPDRFGETFLHNRGTIETVRLIPSANAKSTPRSVAAVSTSQPAQDSPTPPQQRTPGDNPEPNDYSLPRKSIDTPSASAGASSGEPPLPASDQSPEQSTVDANEDEETYQNPALRPDSEGSIHAEVIDLLYASEEPSMRKDFDGKKVTIIGQVAHRNKAQHERGPFQLVRFVMVCCAADVQPVAMLVHYPKTFPDFELMSWVKVVGKVRFHSVGGHLEPVIDALKVTSIPQPAEQYLY